MEEGWLSAVLGTCILQNAVNLAESGKQPITSVGMFAKSERKQSAHENQKDPELPIIKMPRKNPERILQAPFQNFSEKMSPLAGRDLERDGTEDSWLLQYTAQCR